MDSVFKVASVVGGMSEEKQQRILKDCPEVVVATPGRLWHLIDQVCSKYACFSFKISE